MLLRVRVGSNGMSLRALLLCALALSLPGTARAEPGDTPAGTVRLAVAGTIESLDPAKASSATARACTANLYDQLFEYDYAARPFALTPGLAAGMPEVTRKGRELTITLKQGVRYHDDPCFPDKRGRAVTAEDVAYCIKRVMDAQTQSVARFVLVNKIVGLDAFHEASKKVPPNPRLQEYSKDTGYPDVAGLEVLDDQRLRIHLVEPTPELPWLLALDWLSIYPPEAVRFYGPQLGMKVVSTGPYRVVMFLDNRKLILRRNPRYREERYACPADDEFEAGVSLPRTEKIEVRAFRTPQDAWGAFLNGDVDHAEIPRDAFLSVVDPRTQSLLAWAQERRIRLHRNPRLEIFYDAFNWKDKVVGGPAGAKGRAIRRAICLAADDTWAMERLYTNQSERLFGPILPELTGYDPDFTNEWVRQQDESREEALALARETLAEAGLEGGKGVPVLKMHILSDPTSRRVFDILQKQLGDIGIRIEPVPVTWPELQQAWKDDTTQMWSSSWYADYPSTQNFLQLLYGPSAGEPNYSNYKNPEFDKRYEEARALPPGEDPSEIYEEMQDIAMQDCPWRMRFRRIRWAASQEWLHGFRHNDIVPKYFKYLRVDEEARASRRKAWK